jgi:uncharacterized membrane protein
MGTVDVSAELEIRGEPTDVASVMFDPAREPEWMNAVKTVEVIDKAIKPGARVRRTGSVLGHDIEWTTEVVNFQFPHRLMLKIADGPFVGTVTYEIGRSGSGSIARIRNVGEPKSTLVPAALIAGPMRAAMAADLERLKAIVEGT